MRSDQGLFIWTGSILFGVDWHDEVLSKYRSCSKGLAG